MPFIGQACRNQLSQVLTIGNDLVGAPSWGLADVHFGVLMEISPGDWMRWDVVLLRIALYL